MRIINQKSINLTSKQCDFINKAHFAVKIKYSEIGRNPVRVGVHLPQKS